jgi:hypothetical protein
LPARAQRGKDFSVTVKQPAAGSPAEVGLYGTFEAAITLPTTATNPYWPYDATPPGTVPPGTGISMDALFLPPGQTSWSAAKVQPCFWYQPMIEQDAERASTLVATPAEAAHWRVRFAPDRIGTWKWKLRATDGSGTRYSGEFSFNGIASASRGFLRVSPGDRRYFEFADARRSWPSGATRPTGEAFRLWPARSI